MTTSRYNVIGEYGQASHDTHISTSPYWAIAVVPLGRPVTYSRDTNSSIGNATEGTFSRREKPLIITDDCVSLQIKNSKASHIKSLTATLQNSGTNYLSQDTLLPGDWVMAWCWNNEADKTRVLKQIEDGESVNSYGDGLKFVGRAHSIRKQIIVGADGEKSSIYSLQCIGFEELDTQLFYDQALASAKSGTWSTFMAELGLEWSVFVNKEQIAAGNGEGDNGGQIIEALVDIILGKGISGPVTDIIDPAKSPLQIVPQANKEAPFAYMVPVQVATMLGRDVYGKSKRGVFGYSDILETIIGVQKYSGFTTTHGFDPKGFYPAVDEDRSTISRRLTGSFDGGTDTSLVLKGSFVPVNPNFTNRPLFQVLKQYLNPAINEMYTALKCNDRGDIVPTLVARQIPFSTDSKKEDPRFPITRFSSLPRWVISSTMVNTLDVGRSNATRINMIHVYGDAAAFKKNYSVSNQMVWNPPIIDKVDISRSGIKPYMQMVNCSTFDQTREGGARVWMEAIADWAMGSQFTLNGTISCSGIQSPICEGDNIELEGVVYHIESVSHSCSIQPNGIKSFTTSLELSNGMPSDQKDANDDFPRYPGFKNTAKTFEDSQSFSDDGEYVVTRKVNTAKTEGDPEIISDLDPGETVEK